MIHFYDAFVMEAIFCIALLKYYKIAVSPLLFDSVVVSTIQDNLPRTFLQISVYKVVDSVLN